LLLLHADTVDGAERAGQLGTDRLGGGREAVQERDAGVRGQRARRPPDGVRPGPPRLVQGRVGTGPQGSATGGGGGGDDDDGPAGIRRARGVRGRLEVTVVRVPDVRALAQLVLGVVQGSPEFDVSRHGPRAAAAGTYTPRCRRWRSFREKESVSFVIP